MKVKLDLHTLIRVSDAHRLADTGTVGERCALNLTGPDLKREDVHRMAEANRAFVHYRW